MELVNVCYLHPWSLILASIGHAASGRAAQLCSLRAVLINILKLNVSLAIHAPTANYITECSLFYHSYKSISKVTSYRGENIMNQTTVAKIGLDNIRLLIPQN